MKKFVLTMMAIAVLSIAAPALAQGSGENPPVEKPAPSLTPYHGILPDTGASGVKTFLVVAGLLLVAGGVVGVFAYRSR